MIDRSDDLDWKWRKGARTTGANIDNPTDQIAGSDYEFYVFDGASEGTLPPISALVPAGAGWRSIGPRGFQWKGSGLPANSGLTKIQLMAGTDGLASVMVQGRGESLLMPGETPGTVPLPFAGAVTFQLSASGGACWQSTFNDDSCRTPVNSSDKFSGLGD